MDLFLSLSREKNDCAIPFRAGLFLGADKKERGVKNSFGLAPNSFRSDAAQSWRDRGEERGKGVSSPKVLRSFKTSEDKSSFREKAYFENASEWRLSPQFCIQTDNLFSVRISSIRRVEGGRIPWPKVEKRREGYQEEGKDHQCRRWMCRKRKDRSLSVFDSRSAGRAG